MKHSGKELRSFEDSFLSLHGATEWANSLVNYYAETEYSLEDYDIKFHDYRFHAKVSFVREH